MATFSLDPPGSGDYYVIRIAATASEMERILTELEKVSEGLGKDFCGYLIWKKRQTPQRRYTHRSEQRPLR